MEDRRLVVPTAEGYLVNGAEDVTVVDGRKEENVPKLPGKAVTMERKAARFQRQIGTRCAKR